jgi:hypothetical protein
MVLTGPIEALAYLRNQPRIVYMYAPDIPITEQRGTLSSQSYGQSRGSDSQKQRSCVIISTARPALHTTTGNLGDVYRYSRADLVHPFLGHHVDTISRLIQCIQRLDLRVCPLRPRRAHRVQRCDVGDA